MFLVAIQRQFQMLVSNDWTLNLLRRYTMQSIMESML